MQFSLVDLAMNDTWWYELHPHYLINVATLPCEIRNSENVILQWDTTKRTASDVSYMLHRNGPVDYEIWRVLQ